MLLRAATGDDLPAVLAVLQARDTADLGAPDITLGDLADRWSASEFDLARDAAVVELPGVGVVAYADVNRHGAAAAVAPDHEGGSAGSALLEWAERRQVERGHERNRQLIALDDASFSAVPDYVPVSLTAFADDHLRAHDLDVGLSVVGECAGELAGFLLTRRWHDEGSGFIDLLAVHPSHQHRGLGSALLTAAFSRIASGGLKQAELTVASDNPRALGLYERAGMTVRFRQDVWERAISRESDGLSG